MTADLGSLLVAARGVTVLSFPLITYIIPSSKAVSAAPNSEI